MKIVLTAAVLALTSIQAIAFPNRIPQEIKDLPELCQLETQYSHLIFEKQSCPGFSERI